jgi:Lysyl oxidase
MDSLGPVRRHLCPLATALCLTILAIPASADAAENPCIGPESRLLLCPDLRVGPAAELYVERGGRYGYGGGTLLHAGNDIRSRGRGPIELRGRRYKRNWMRANQAIYRVGGGVEVFRTEAKLHFFSVGYEFGGSFWKVHDPLSMEIWTIDERHQPVRRVRKGPKVFYCFRDLERTKAMPRSPAHRVYPACNQDPSRKRVRLGTSVGWSDIYPSTYDRQWVNVSGLRGCFAFVMRVDPKNLLFEEHEGNNRSTRIIRLPYRDGPQRC